MKQETFTTIILEADNGKYLTQSADVDPRERIIAKEVALGRNDSPLNWCEVSATVAERLERERNEAMDKEREADENID